MPKLSLNTKVVNKAKSGDFTAYRNGFMPADVTANELAEHISKGYAVAPALFKVSDGGLYIRNNSNFDSAEMLGLDIDNSITERNGQKRRKMESEGYLSLDNVTSNNWIKNNAFLIYTTASHHADWNRFRILFHLPTTYTSAEEYRAVVSAFIKKFGSDSQCVAVSQPFYGNSEALVFPYGQTINADDVARTLAEYSGTRREERKASKELGEVAANDIREMLSFVPKHLAYIDWVKIISSVASAVDAETAEQLIEEWSPGSPGEVAYKIANRLQNVTIGTLIYKAREGGWLPPEGFYKERTKTYPLTDSGNAERFVEMFGEDVRYECNSKRWFIWDGRRFAEDVTGMVYRMALDSVRAITEGLPDTVEDEEQQKIHDKIRAFARKSESRSSLDNLLTLAGRGTNIVCTYDEIDCDPYAVNFRNAIYHLEYGKYDHDPKYGITKLINIDFNEDIDFDAERDCPKWLAFLRTVMDNNESLVDFLQRALGYSLSGLTTEQCLFFCYGSGKNGKSVFFDALKELFGEYYQKAPTEMLMAKYNDGIPNDVARLRGVRFVVAAELPENKRFDESRIKDLTGGDRITARYLHSEYFEFDPTHTIWLYGNHKPTIIGTDDGIWRRIHLIPFTVTISEEKRRPMNEIMDEFRIEQPSILRWMIEGYMSWREDGGLKAPKIVTEATQEYKEEMNTVGNFIAEKLDKQPGSTASFKDVYECYAKWCGETNEYTMKKRTFNNKMREMGFTEAVNSYDRTNHWQNVKLISNVNDKF